MPLQLLNPLLQSLFESMARRFMWLRLWKLSGQNTFQLLPDSLLALEQFSELPIRVEVEQAVAGRFAMSG